MKNRIMKLFQHEVVLYLIAGVATTIVYFAVRMGLFLLISDVVTVTLIANSLAILFAFWVNDRFVFKQVTKGWPLRLVKFTSARLATLFLDVALAWLLVDSFPQLIGQFVNNNIQMVNAVAALIGQVLIMVSNYFLSKFFVFKDKK